MSVDERLRAVRVEAAVLDPEGPLAVVRHRVHRRRLVRRGVAVAVVVLAVVAVSAAALRPHHEPRVTAGVGDEQVHLDLPAGYERTSDGVVRPADPHVGVDGLVEVLLEGDDGSMRIASRRVPDGSPDTRFELDGPRIQGAPSQLRETAPGEWTLFVPDLHGWELTIQSRVLPIDHVLDVAEHLEVRGRDVLHAPPSSKIRFADHLDVPDRQPVNAMPSVYSDVAHPVLGAQMTVRRIDHVRLGHHLTLDLVDGYGSTRTTEWLLRSGQRIEDLGIFDALLVEDGGERRVGWEQGGHSLALRTDDPGIGDDELVAIARSVRFSG